MNASAESAWTNVSRAKHRPTRFTAAALSLGYSQPAISQMVRRLETRTGTTLVERVGRSVRLTEAGAVLARHAGPVLSALDAAEEEVAAIADRVGLTNTTAASVEAALASLHDYVWDRPPRVLICGSLYLAGEVLAANGTLPE